MQKFAMFCVICALLHILKNLLLPNLNEKNDDILKLINFEMFVGNACFPVKLITKTRKCKRVKSCSYANNSI